MSDRRHIATLSFKHSIRPNDLESLQTIFDHRWNYELVFNLPNGHAKIYKTDE